MATLQSWRKAYGALKDTTKVGLAKVNSEFKDVDVAIVKATNHVECPPKERHLRKILAATSVMRPRADVAYCIHALSRRLAKTHNWTVALKTLIVIHRTLREGDPTFREELLSFSQRGRILQLSNFKDDSSPIAWDCSAWVRTYALFLEERLECFRVLKYDIEAERLPKSAPGQEKGYSRTRDLESEELLEQLPALQQLLYRLIGCRAAGLSDFYEVCRGLELARNFQFPNLREPPQSFLATMEEYIKEAPRIVSVSREPLELPERLLLTYHPEEEVPSPTDAKPPIDEPNHVPFPSEAVPEFAVPSPPPSNAGDLLGLSDMANPAASAIEESNALALAIVPTDASAYNNNGFQAKELDPTGWELALVTTPSNNLSAANERQLVSSFCFYILCGSLFEYREILPKVILLSTNCVICVNTLQAGGLDTLTLNSLYDEGAYRASQQPVYGAPAPNPFEAHDPFALSNSVAPPAAVQMASIGQQQQMNPFTPFQPNYHQPPPQQQQNLMMAPANPFGDAGFGPFPHTPQPQGTNPFGLL
ncbi:hypothetical protein Syun_022039 [Stephania yunnanensis]|uniref:ENTH domain-containing protein n=1 Tax=Stephania yunnanensis TaxID=152371 RepID=A0AAP0IH35_9MAGN